MNDPEKTKQSGLAASVMDYLPIHLAPIGKEQGDFFTTTIGPYDIWAIEYGYKPLPGGSLQAELAELKKIAARSTEEGLSYATDEDARAVDPDPLANRFDLGKDPLRYARSQAERIEKLWPGLVDRVVEHGDAYERARRALNILLSYHGTAMYYAGRFVGGVYVHRHHKGDPDAQPPFVVVESKKQREALQFLCEQALAKDAYRFPPELWPYLAPSKWSHWGTTSLDRVDFPVHEVVLSWQDRVLGQLLSTTSLERIVDSELKVQAGGKPFTAAELLEALTGAIFVEFDGLKDGKFTAQKHAVNSLRRNLQRRYLQRLANLALGRVSAPEDCQTVAFTELETLEARIRQVLAGKAQLDPYTQSHLKESVARISKVLDARMLLTSP